MIRTNGGKLTVNAENDIVNHYNEVQTLDIQAVDLEHSYHEFGKVGYATISKGHFVAEAKSEIKAIVNNGAKEEVKIDKDSSATVVRAFTTDNSAKLTEHGGNVSLDYLEASGSQTVEQKLEEIKHDAEAEYLAIYRVNGKYYLSLGDVIERVPAQHGQGYNFTGEYEIQLLKDVSDYGFDVAGNGKLTLNLNGHTYNINSTVGSAGTTTNGIHPLSGSEITIKNGTIKSSVGKMIVNAYGKFNAENVVFDCSEMSINHYGTFTGANAIYSGLECCIFVCNGYSASDHCVMTLTNCEIIMPTSSNKGVSVDGELTLINTKVDGYISVNRGGKLTVDNESICTKEIQAYFDNDNVTKEGNVYTNLCE